MKLYQMYRLKILNYYIEISYPRDSSNSNIRNKKLSNSKVETKFVVYVGKGPALLFGITRNLQKVVFNKPKF